MFLIHIFVLATAITSTLQQNISWQNSGNYLWAPNCDWPGLNDFNQKTGLTSLINCLDYCNNTSGCTHASFTNSSVCYLKSTIVLGGSATYKITSSCGIITSFYNNTLSQNMTLQTSEYIASENGLYYLIMQLINFFPN